MTVVFIEEVGGPLRVGSNPAIAEREGIAWADVDVSALAQPPHCYTLVNGAAVEIAAEVDSHTMALAKQARDEALDALEYDFGDGRIMQTRPKDEQNVKGAIELLTLSGEPSTMWLMKDDVKHLVTKAELEAALLAGRLAAKAIWDAI